jgi:hypothetical protein
MLSVSENRPRDARQLVGERHDRDIRMNCKILDLRFQAVPGEITPCHSSRGGEFGEGIDVVKDAQHRLRRRERSSRP